MKVALVQLNFHIGNFDQNIRAISGEIRNAAKQGADLVIFSELSVCGYPPQDLLEHEDFVLRCERGIREVAKICTDTAAIVGAPSVNPEKKGKKLFNSAFFLHGGEVRQVFHKTLLPTYDIFDENRYFENNRTFELLSFKGYRLGVTICEDLWFEQPLENEFSRRRMYTVDPAKKIGRLNPDLMVNIAASPFSYSRHEIRKNILMNQAGKLKIPILYINQVGANSELIFDGASLAINPRGEVVEGLPSFVPCTRHVNIEDLAADRLPPLPPVQTDIIEKIYDAIVLGIRDYFGKLGFKRATLGLSGGIDSAVSLALATKALGPENVTVLLMPSQYSSEHSMTDAIELAKNLKVRYHIVDIREIFAQFRQGLHPIFGDLPEDVAEENIQSRIRGTLLMAVANKFNMLLLNTSNKSEAAVGYGTLYGDMAGGLSVLGDVYKTDVYRLARFINKKGKVIPGNILQKAPSAELKPGQKDTDSLPDYELLDNILYRYIELQQSAKQIIRSGTDEETTRDVIRKVNMNEHKRYQTPPILRISSKAFGIGRRMPLVAKFD